MLLAFVLALAVLCAGLIEDAAEDRIYLINIAILVFVPLVSTALLGSFFQVAVNCGLEERSSDPALPPPPIENIGEQWTSLAADGLMLLFLCGVLFAPGGYILLTAPDVGSSEVLVRLGVCVLLPLGYLPMGFGLATTAGNILRVFNPVAVCRGILNGGFNYLFIFGLGAAVFMVLVVGLLVMPPAGSFVASMLAYAVVLPLCVVYALGVQGFLVGRLLSIHQDDFGDLL